MCGRFVQRYTWDDIQDLYDLPNGPAPQAASPFVTLFDCSRSRNAPRRSGVEGGLGRSLSRSRSPALFEQFP
jgi:hypothetical protein